MSKTLEHRLRTTQFEIPIFMVRFQVMTLIVGLTIDKSISIVLSNPSPFRVFCAIYLWFTLFNFYHAKITATENEDYFMRDYNHPLLSIVDFALNIMLIGSFLFISYLLSDFYNFLIANIAMRTLDSLLVGLSLWILHSRGKLSSSLTLAHSYWALTDIVIIVIFSLYLLLGSPDEPCVVAVIVLLIAMTDPCLDYWINRGMYFNT